MVRGACLYRPGLYDLLQQLVDDADGKATDMALGVFQVFVNNTDMQWRPVVDACGPQVGVVPDAEPAEFSVSRAL